MKKRVLCLTLVAVLLLSMLPVPVLASQGICDHHTAHTEQCGYAPATESRDCGHVHSDTCQQPLVSCVHTHGDECWKPGETGGEPVLECVHTECTVESGCVAADIVCVHQHGNECWETAAEGEEPVLNCVHTQCTVESGCATIKLVCNHTSHDTECGYCEGSTEVPCGYNCEVCASLEAGNCAHGNGIESCPICQVEAMIDALPTYDELQAMDTTAYTAAIEQIKAAINAYDALSDAEQAQVRNADELAALQVEASKQAQTGDIAASGECGGEGNSATWVLSGDGLLTISGNGGIAFSPQEYKSQIKTVIIEAGVTTIGNGAFSGCSNLSSITIPDSVNEIQNEAFQNCSSLSNIQLPDGISTIYPTTFTHCVSLTSINIPSSVITIGANAFFNCTSLTSITIPDSVTKLGDSAFAGCTSLTSITIPESVEDIEYGVFRGCTSLSSIYVDSNNSDYSSIDGILYDFSGTTLITCPEGKSGSISIPAGVTTIENGAFINCTQITDVLLSSSITKIYPLAFSNCTSLTDLTVASANADFGDNVFTGCNTLNTIIFTTDPPTFSQNTFNGLVATAYYTASNSAWTEEIRQNYGGTITWKPVGDSGGNPDNPELVDYVRLLPENGATDVGYDHTNEPVFEITYEKEIASVTGSNGTVFPDLDFNAGTLKIFKKADDTLVHEVTHDAFLNDMYGITGTTNSESRVVNGKTFSLDLLNPQTVLEPGTEYYITVDAGFIIFTDGTTCKDIKKGDWEFTTQSKTCSLNELTNIDYLAFAELAYSSPPLRNTTVREMIGDKWFERWSNDITYAELYHSIQHWKFECAMADLTTGFMAMAFVNEDNEYIISYRGSTAWELLEEDAYSWFTDWVKTNGNMLINNDAGQVEQAFQFYSMIKSEKNSVNIGITGHSLGGALGDIVSAYSGDFAMTFNAAPFLDIAYAYYPEKMSKMFAGTNSWNFIDCVIDRDIVGTVSSAIKPRIVYEDKELSKKHSLKAFVFKDSNGKLSFSYGTKYNVDKLTWIMPDFSLIELDGFLTSGKYIDFGTSGDDVFIGLAGSDKENYKEILSGVYSRRSYGGTGDDSIASSLWEDIIVGGKGTDFLAGNTGGDTYIYNKGDGTDYITDFAGNDVLYLQGFGSDDLIYANTTPESDYIDIYCYSEILVRIDKRCRAPGNYDNFLVKVGNVSVWNIHPSYFNPKKYTGRLIVTCPVNILIKDISGKTVYSVDGTSEGVYFTEYGDFYVFREETGGYGKIVDIVEGYSISIEGNDNGEMDVSVYDCTDDGLSDVLQAKDIPVTSNLIATVEDIDGKKYLVLDTDGDGSEDNRVQLTESGTVHTHSGGTATCTQKAICSGCGEAYGNYAAHDYETTWSQGNASGHWHKCKNCDAHDSQVPHVPGPAATATTDQTCTECGYVIQAATGSPTTETTQPAIDPPTTETTQPTTGSPTTETTQPVEDDDPVKYSITSGKNKKWRRGSEYGLAITVDAAQTDFVRVLVDGTELFTSCYTVSGNTTVTLRTSYLESLPLGKYAIRIEFSNGYGETTFTVASAITAGMPFTGDNFNLAFWLGVNITSGLSLVGILAWFLRKRYLNKRS